MSSSASPVGSVPLNEGCLAAGKQPLTLADTVRPAFTQGFADAADIVRGADQVPEWGLEVLCQVSPVSCIDVEAVQDFGDILRDDAFLVLTENASAPVDQFEIVGQAKRQAFGHGLTRVAGERHQSGGLLVEVVG